MDADRSYVGQVVDVTMRYLQGQELDGLFLAGVETALKAAREDEAVTSLLDDWLSGVCLHQLGLFSVWGRKGRWRQAYICWSNAAAKLTKMTGRAVPHVGMEEMMAELRLRGCVYQKRSMHALLSLAATYPALKQLRSAVHTEARWVVSMRYPLFGVAQYTVEVLFGLFTLLAIGVSIVLLHRMMISFPILALTADVSRDRLKEMVLISYEGAALSRYGLGVFGSRILTWAQLGLWVLALQWVPAWWIRRLLR